MTLNPERESVVAMAIGNTNRQPLASEDRIAIEGGVRGLGRTLWRERETLAPLETRFFIQPSCSQP